MTDVQRKSLWLSLVLFSFMVFAASVVLRAGIANTPGETRDSLGRTMRFNDRFSAEHYGIIVENIRIQTLFDVEYLYEWFLLAMHLTGARLLMSSVHFGRKQARWFFLSQAVLFPFGWLGFFCLPGIVAGIAQLSLDREDFVDIPFVWFTAQPVWIATALIIAFSLPRRISPPQNRECRRL